MRATGWMSLSNGPMLGRGGAALEIMAHAMGLAREWLFPKDAPASQDVDATLGDSADGGEAEPASPVIASMTSEVFSIAQKARCAARAIEPLFRADDGSYGGLDGEAWSRIPRPLMARIEAVLIDRAVDRMRSGVGADGETMMVSLAPASLASPLVHRRLQLVPADAGPRPRLVLLARGGLDALAGIARAPGGRWRDCVGLHLVEPPRSLAEIERFGAPGLACLQIEARLLNPQAEASELTWTLLLRTARRGVPVIVGSMVDPALFKRLQEVPSVFAFGPLFARGRAAA